MKNPENEKILNLKPEWEISKFSCGGISIEQMIGGARVSMLLPDGSAISEELTSEEFYEIFYARFKDGNPGGMIVYGWMLVWAVLCVGVAAYA